MNAPDLPGQGTRFVTAAVLVTVTVTAGCSTPPSDGRVGSSPRPSSTATANGQEEARFAKLSLPRDARILQVGSESGIDRLVLLKIGIPRGQRDAFLNGSRLPPPQPGDNAVQTGLGRSLGWRLNELKRIEGVTDEGDPVRQVVIDTSDPATLTVYVAAFST